MGKAKSGARNLTAKRAVTGKRKGKRREVVWKLATSGIFFASSIESFCFLGPGFFFLFTQGELSGLDFSPSFMRFMAE